MAMTATPFNACPDDGRCWHSCDLTPDGKGLPCWRVLAAEPFTNQYPSEPDGRWPEAVTTLHQEADRMVDSGVQHAPSDAVNDRRGNSPK